MSFNANKKGGYSIIEILIAIVFFTASISFTIIILSNSQNVLVNRENDIFAKNLSREGLNGASVIIKNNWYGIADGEYGLLWENNVWSFSGTQDTQNIFTRKITVTTIQNGEREIDSAVTWQESPLRPQEEVELATILTNWVNVVDTGGDDGGGGITGDWRNPRTLGSVDLGPGNSATDLDVKNKIVYMSATASSASKPDFFIVDASNGSSPFVVSQLNTGTGLNAVDMAGDYAYVANNNSTFQLQVIDVSSIENPELSASFQLPGVSGAGAKGNSIFYSSKKIYIGTKKATGPEFHIIDVSTPTNPEELGSYEVGDDVNAIVVKEGIAYIATPNNEGELEILDISDPSDITEISSFDALGDSEEGKCLFLANPKIYLGRTIGGDHINHHELHILDISTPATPLSLGSKNFSSSINDLVVEDYLMFLATNDSNNEFQIWNISNPSDIVLWSSFNFPQMASGIDYEDNLVYVSVRSNDGLRIITSTP